MHGRPRGARAAAAALATVVGYLGVAFAEDVTSAIRGVAPADEARYRPLVDRDGVATFRCFDSTGSAVAAPLPFAAVNDDACDCADGSDEPGTAACAGQQQTLFFCRNERSDAAYIYASRVNDGICDCCDGSDEWHPTRTQRQCPNTCEEEGQRLRLEREQKEAELRRGLGQRRSLIEAAVAEKRKLEKELKQLQAELPALEAKESEAKAALDRAKKEASPETPAEKATEAAAAEEAVAEEAAAEEVATAEEASAEVPPSEQPGAKAADSGSEGPVVSEYAKWMEGAGKEEAAADAGPAPASPAPTPVPTPAPTPAPAPASPAGPGFFARAWGKVSGMFSRLWQKESAPILEAAEQAHTDAKAKAASNKDRTEEITKKLGLMTDENSMAYSSLSEECLSKKVGNYDYSVCFFNRATQDSETEIGHWKHWEEPGVALFSDGDECPGGPERSLKVRFQCGPEAEVQDVSEPSRCTYEALASHPAACTEDRLRALEARAPRRPTDEL